MNFATAEMIAGVGTNLAKLITDMYIRIDTLERQLNSFRDEVTCEQSHKDFNDTIDAKIEKALDDYDPTNHPNFRYEVRCHIDEKLDDLDTVDKDDVRDIVRDLISEATLTIEVN